MTPLLRSLRALALVVGLSITAMVAGASTVHAASGVPYQDPSASGYVGLCDKAGHQITHGSITTKPFAWRAVSSVAAKPPYNGPGGTAVLVAYQPIQNVPSGDWSGDMLTASSRYTDPAHPMAAATGSDESLKDFMGEFRPMWNGLLQLRIFLGAPEQQINSVTYPATDIRVTGDTWQVVDGGTVNCGGSGKSVSIETILLPKSTPKSKSKGTSQQKVTSPGKATATPSTVATPSGARAGLAPSASPVASQTGSGSGNHTSAAIVILIAAVAVLTGFGYGAVRRRRGPRSSGNSSSLAHSSPEKGR
jgi:hypothetical protein